MKRLKDIPRRLLIALFWVGVWWGVAKAVGLPKLLPGPGETALAFVRLCGTEAYWRSVGFTLLRVALGFVLAVVRITKTTAEESFCLPRMWQRVCRYSIIIKNGAIFVE